MTTPPYPIPGSYTRPCEKRQKKSWQVMTKPPYPIPGSYTRPCEKTTEQKVDKQWRSRRTQFQGHIPVHVKNDRTKSWQAMTKPPYPIPEAVQPVVVLHVCAAPEVHIWLCMHVITPRRVTRPIIHFLLIVKPGRKSLCRCMIHVIFLSLVEFIPWTYHVYHIEHDLLNHVKTPWFLWIWLCNYFSIFRWGTIMIIFLL